MTVEEIATRLATARQYPTEQRAFVAFAALVDEREKLLDAWKVVLHKSPIGPASWELTEATTKLMRAEEKVRAALGYRPNNHD